MNTEEFFTPTIVFWKCVWDTAVAELGKEISNIDSWFMEINSRKILAMICRI